MPHTPFTAPNGDTDWPSVTEVGNIIAKPGLYSFYATNGMDGAKKILEDTGRIGSEYHQGIHDRFSGKPESYTEPLARQMVDAFFAEFVTPYKAQPLSLETKVVNHKERYHGTYDGIVHVSGMPYGRGTQGLYSGPLLADWKSSSGIYRSHGIQLGGYWGAENNPPQHGLIVQVRRKDIKVRRQFHSDLKYYYEEFLNARRLWDYEHSKGRWAK